MTTTTMDLRERLEKTADTDFLREMIGFTAQRLMEREVETLTGATHGSRSADRLTHRNGYRGREWDTRAGTAELCIPKIRKGSYFPGFLEPRRMGEKALTNRRFQAPAPNVLWVSDFSYVATWQGFVYVAFVIDAFARRVVGWRVSRSAQADFVLDALEQALCDRRPVRQRGLLHHSDRGVQCVSIRYTARLLEAGIELSVGGVGDSYDNALAETSTARSRQR